MSTYIRTPKAPKAPFFKSIGDEKSPFKKAPVTPAANINETEEHYLLCMAAPGLKKKDFNIEIVDNIITISAMKQMQPLAGIKDRCEYDYTNWTRSFTLPADAEVILAKASYEEGELIIRIPKGGISESEKPLKVLVY